MAAEAEPGASPGGAASKRNLPVLLLKGVLALFVSVGAFWWAFRDVEAAALFEKLKGSSAPILALYAFVQILIHVVRTIRWGILLEPVGKISRRALVAASSVGIPAAMFLPLRLGELVRPAMVARHGVSFAGAMASVVVERVADGVINVGLFFLLLSMIPGDGGVDERTRSFARIALFGFGGALVFLFVAVIARAAAQRWLRMLLTPLSPSLADRATGMLASFLDGLSALAGLRRALSFAALTLVYWGLNGYATTLLAHSYGIDVPWFAGPFTISAVVFVVMIPAGPAFAGTMEAGFVMGLRPFGVPETDAAVVAIAAHIVTVVMFAAIAGFGLLLDRRSER